MGVVRLNLYAIKSLFPKGYGVIKGFLCFFYRPIRFDPGLGLLTVFGNPHLDQVRRAFARRQLFAFKAKRAHGFSALQFHLRKIRQIPIFKNGAWGVKISALANEAGHRREAAGRSLAVLLSTEH